MRKKEKIPYDDELADDIIRQFALNPSVKRVWKTRGHIPGDYLDPNRDSSEKLQDFDSEYQKFVAILAMPEVMKSKFRTLGKKGVDIEKGKDRMTEAERIGFKTEVTEIRNLLRTAMNTMKARDILKAIKDARIHPTKVVGHKRYDKINRDAMYDQDKSEIKVLLLSLYNRLRI